MSPVIQTPVTVHQLPRLCLGAPEIKKSLLKTTLIGSVISKFMLKDERRCISLKNFL